MAIVPPGKNTALDPILSTDDDSLWVIADKGAVVVAEMSLERWLATADHPKYAPSSAPSRWRHAARARGIVVETFRQVAAAAYRGALYKLNGHERARLWQSGELAAPESVFVQIYRARSRLDLNALFATFNPQSGAQYDKVALALERAGLRLRSNRLRYGYILTALNLALRGTPRSHQDKKATPPIDVERAVEVFRKELELLDSVNPRPEIFYNGLVAAALLALARHPKEGLAFFAKISAREGSKREGALDPVETVLAAVERLKSKRRAWVTAQQQGLCATTLGAFSAWLRATRMGETAWLRGKPPAAELAPWIEEVKRRKGILDVEEL